VVERVGDRQRARESERETREENEHRVQLVRRDGRDVSTLYGSEGGRGGRECRGRACSSAAARAQTLILDAGDWSSLPSRDQGLGFRV